MSPPASFLLMSPPPPCPAVSVVALIRTIPFAWNLITAEYVEQSTGLMLMESAQLERYINCGQSWHMMSIKDMVKKRRQHWTYWFMHHILKERRSNKY
ncbi:uncharacterized protein LOC130999385 isoform X2 [Salvia miltiorrhiza]|uniref:uncharacterized protein LOC130999385 isoform X2 n=1 Tax=Salvia miltiorrhiza TaxID=226208 RepID=UPI0025AB9C6F|nr:uncharacterized protein LOC130999385 isoform X2 [Salvia miltiorrhiza]